jgi:cell division protease FtsH
MRGFMKMNQKTILLWFGVIILSIFFAQAWEMKQKDTIKNFGYEKFLKAAELGELDTTKLFFDKQMNKISGEVIPSAQVKYEGKQFNIDANVDKAHDEVGKYHIIPNYKASESDNFLVSFLTSWLPLLLIVGMFIFIMRQIQAGGGKAMSFGKSKAKLVENKNKINFKDVAGVDEAKDDLQEIVHFLKDPKKYTKLGGRIPKGVLLVGPPGTGKTLLARSVAGEAGVPFFTISGSDFVEMFVGVGASRVRDLFEQGKKQAPCIIFIDEIDAVGRHRGAGMGGGHDEREQTLNQLLVEMDGFESTEGVILIAATNRPDVLDPALLRPGRFDRRVVVGKPDLLGREQILAVHMKKTPLGPDVDVNKIARGTPGFSGADLENLVNEAALNAARYDKKFLNNEDFEKAKDKVIMGSERKSMVISDEDKKITAYHEAGHTLVGKKLAGIDPIHKVTIIPRGMALGLTQTLPEKEMLNLSKSKAHNMLAFLFGGRAAEEIIFNDYTTGAGNDIERATSLARSMVTEWGMSQMGPQAFEKSEGPVFLGMNYGQKSKNYSDAKALQIDTEVTKFIDEGYALAKEILTTHRDALERLTQALLEFETIDGAEVEMLVNGAAVSELAKVRQNKKNDGGSGLSSSTAESDKADATLPSGKTARVT